jgi:hypothetical protein
MGLITGSNLANASEVIDTIRTTLVAEGWTLERSTGSTGADSLEIFLSLPAVDTFNGNGMLVGLKSQNSGNELRVTMSHLTAAAANVTGSPQNTFSRVLGTPGFNYTAGATGSGNPVGNSGDTYEGVVLTANSDNNGGTSNGWGTGANYLRHWIFTPNSSPFGSTEVYCYAVVEVETGVFRTIAFGEGIKLGGGSWDGGLFFTGTYIDTGQAERSERTFYGDYQRTIFDDNEQGGFILNFNNPQIQSASPAVWCPWVAMGYPSQNGASAIGMGNSAMGLDFIGKSPSPFSGQAIRVPSRFYQMNVIEGAGPPRLRPLIECPDVFLTNIVDLTPGDVVLDDVERFLVVPASAKTGATSTGNAGFLIRNSLL